MDEKVQYPAIALMIIACIDGVIGAMSFLVNSLALVGNIAFLKGSSFGAIQNELGTGFSLFASVLGIGVSIVIFICARKMYRFEDLTMATVGAALACMPIGTCCCISLPFGIWALIALADPLVRESFQK